ncbi:MAG: SRPBCC domain-containing protein, partial [Candidatus Poribacteria bacterium]|nr:SRPBCC domain-containing protein [Candidatus Poribacteria bacterium]
NLNPLFSSDTYGRRAQMAEAIALEIKRTLNASPDKVFSAWTDPKQIPLWFAPHPSMSVPSAVVDLKVGGAYRVVFKDPEGDEYVAVGEDREINRPSKLVFTWGWEEADEGDSIDTLVTIQLRENNGGTDLILTHENFVSAESRDKHEHGWVGCLEGLAKHLA